MATDATFYRKNDWVRDNYLDWSDFDEFKESPPQTITSASIAPVADLTFTPVLINGLSTYWTTSGGTAGKSYATKVTIITSGSKTLTADVVFVTLN